MVKQNFHPFGFTPTDEIYHRPNLYWNGPFGSRCCKQAMALKTTLRAGFWSNYGRLGTLTEAAKLTRNGYLYNFQPLAQDRGKGIPQPRLTRE